MQVYAHECRGQKWWTAQELELLGVESHLIWSLGIKLGSFRKAAHISYLVNNLFSFSCLQMTPHLEWLYLCEVMYDSSILFWFLMYFVPVPRCVCYYSPVLPLRSDIAIPLTLLFLLKIALAVRILCFQMNFMIFPLVLWNIPLEMRWELACNL